MKDIIPARKAPVTVMLFRFIKAYVKSMRLYYAFLTGIAGWTGVSFYLFTTERLHYAGQIAPSPFKTGLILFFLFCVWGINQIINDYLGLPEDRINAPERPMVTGELDAKAALAVSIALLCIVALVTWLYLQPLALIPMAVGLLLNVIYEYAKGYGIWGNIIFGVMISTCAMYGFLACGPYMPPLFTAQRVGVLILIALLNGIMTYFTYFKDYFGDKHVGKKTLVVKYGPEKARLIGILFSLLPTLAFGALVLFGYFSPQSFSRTFWLLATLSFALQAYTAWLYFRHYQGEKTYYSLKTNFRACVCGQATLIAMFQDTLGMALFLVSYIFVGFLFDLSANSKA
ncbi:MAG: UbiA family prenyltransferase [Zoogloeaceae bacterium]|jgi:geranylgeranylglycerol-phosphate geranylgeranyltransferase|nr:UbiA family prenyltransferase [Zoogloeaceae bacterium]